MCKDNDLSCMDLRPIEKELIKRFVNIGLVKDENTALKLCEEALSSLEKEPIEQEVLIKAIKTFTKEKKAQHALGYDSDDEFFMEDGTNEGPKTPMNRTKTSGFRDSISIFKKKKNDQTQQEKDGVTVLSRTASNSFFKTTSRSTAISSKESKRSIFYGTQKTQE